MDPDYPLEWVKASEMCSPEDVINDPECQYKGAVTGERPQDVQDNQSKKRLLAEEHAYDRTPHLFNLEGEIHWSAAIHFTIKFHIMVVFYSCFKIFFYL